MDTSKKLTTAGMAACLLWSGFTYAGCDPGSFSRSAAALTCQNATFTYQHYDGSDIHYCAVTAQCKTGGTTTDTYNYKNNPDPNATQGQELTQWKATNILTTIEKVESLQNRGGNLSE